MDKDKPIWSGRRIVERWKIYTTELGSYIYQGLPAYEMAEGEFIKVPANEISRFDEDRMTDLVFRPSDIEAFEEKNDLLQNESQMAAEDARELGRLRVEKKAWDKSIVAAVRIGLFCASKGGEFVRGDIYDEIMNIDQGIPNTTMNTIWKAIPDKYKKGPGRPRKA